MTDEMKSEIKRPAIKAPIPSEIIATKTVAGKRIEFVPWYDIAELLDQRIGGKYWTWTIKEVSQVTSEVEEEGVKRQPVNLVVVIGKLEVIYQDAIIVREAIGTEPITKTGYGDAVSSAQASAFRKAAAYLGIGRELWRK